MAPGSAEQDSAPQDTAAKGGAQAVLPRLAYRLLTGSDDRAFCERISTALAEGYVLYGSPSMAVRGGSVVCAQAVVLPNTLPQALPDVLPQALPDGLPDVRRGAVSDAEPAGPMGLEG